MEKDEAKKRIIEELESIHNVWILEQIELFIQNIQK